jgi:hypothetical protein
MDPVATSGALTISPMVDYDISWEGAVMIVAPRSDGFPSNASVTLTIGTGAKDLAGNALPEKYTLSFSVQGPDQSGNGGGFASTDLTIVAIAVAIIGLVLVIVILLFVLRRRKGRSMPPSYPGKPSAYQQQPYPQYQQQPFYQPQGYDQRSDQNPRRY